MFAWRNLSNANLLAAFEWLAARRDNGSANRDDKAAATETSTRPTSSPAR